MSVRRPLLKFSAKIIIATFMTVAGGILVGAILLRSLLFYPEEPNLSEPVGAAVTQE